MGGVKPKDYVKKLTLPPIFTQFLEISLHALGGVVVAKSMTLMIMKTGGKSNFASRVWSKLKKPQKFNR